MTKPSGRKSKMTYGTEQKLEYAKLMVVEGYSTKQIMDISGAGDTAATRWKKQYLEELKGQTPEGKKALTAEQQRIQELEKQRWRAKRDNEILKKAAAFFVRDNSERCW